MTFHWNNRILCLEAASEMEAGSLCARGGMEWMVKGTLQRSGGKSVVQMEPEPVSWFFANFSVPLDSDSD